MRLFFAGNVVGQDQATYDAGIRRKLLSYADLDTWGKDAFPFWVDNAPDDVEFFLDSGAFSAFTRGAVLSLDGYCTYIENHLASLHCYAAMDVIGDWDGSDRNLQIMLDRGLSPLPVFHYEEPVSALRKILSQHKHIALGGVAGIGGSREMLTRHLDMCWNTIKDYWPVKVHGFGIMAQWALERYPFYSVDSSSAIVSAGMGGVSTFDHGTIQSHNWRDYARRTLDGGVMDHVAEDRAKKGSAHMGRRYQNIRTQLILEDHVTRLWASRGVTW